MECLVPGKNLLSVLESWGYAHVSSGTLHPADLAEAMYSAVMEYAEPGPELDAWSERILGMAPAAAWNSRDDPFWEKEDSGWLLDELADSIDLIAPEGCWFGASEGDAAEYAVWRTPEEAEEEACAAAP